MVTDQSELAIQAQGVARRFGARWVLRGVTLAVEPGEIVGLLGANGCGKTTLLRIFGTLLKPSAGTARIYGHDVVTETDAVLSLTSSTTTLLRYAKRGLACSACSVRGAA